MSATDGRYQVWIDRGGTFTDCIGLDPQSGELRVAKLLSSDRAPLDGIRKLLRLETAEPIPPCDIRMGTTIATNALLERRGAKTALIISEGFGDLLRIGDQTRPDLFALRIERAEPPVAAVAQLPARMDARGDVLQRPEREAALAALTALRAQGISSLAVVFLHAYQSGALESECAVLAREAGFRDISLSHEIACEIGFLARAGTTALDAYLTPALRGYVDTLLAELPGSTLRIMQSSGGLTDARRFRGRNALLSGPAGGVVAVAHIAKSRRLAQVIGFDMGGTSTDVSRFAGSFERRYETQVAGLLLRAPSMHIHTVAAGGGSICRFDGERLRVGPESAGADPGPLCYGHPQATQLTLTDVNLALGRLLPDRFPFALDRGRVDAALEHLASELRTSLGPEAARDTQSVARGFFEVAVEHMAEAIRQVSIAEGHDVREHSLIVFGGAGGQHACAVARKLEIREIVLHPLGGVLSAFGMGMADDAWHGEADAARTRLARGAWPSDFDARFSALEAQGRAQVVGGAPAPGAIAHVRRIDLRYAGSEAALTLPIAPLDTLVERFETEHRERYGYARPGHPVEAVTLRVETIARSAPMPLRPAEISAADGGVAPVHATARLWVDDGVVEAPVYLRESLVVGETLTGPAIVLESAATVVIDPGFSARLERDGCIVLVDRSAAVSRRADAASIRDPVLLEVFAHRFMSIAEQMGLSLQRTALSTNIRERKDFSCAVFDAQGELVANAPHIPVHLGAMSESIRAVLALRGVPKPGEVYATNAPDLGGSHLPDITVITPVFDRAGKLEFFTASRGHHADVGGISPGSMPPFSRTLTEEGVELRGLCIVRDGVLDDALLRRVFRSGLHPARDIAQNLADLTAQVAANQTGARMLGELSARFGEDTTRAYMGHVLDDAQRKVERAIAELGDGEHCFADAMDDGTRIAVALRVHGSRMQIDFTGTSPEVDTNLNAPRAVTVAAVLYVLRALVGTPIPLNNGCLRPIDLIIPERSVLAPSRGRAVVAGNVETSQRVVDVMLAALGKLAACQGTMNNLTFGDERFGYYETIAGGAGAGQGFDGASGVHTHMTNTRITDAEVLEARFPVRLWRFSLRPGSGGAGRFHGGDGVVRELEALRPLEFSILSERRSRAPFGLAGGEPGRPGRNFHAGREIPGRASFRVLAGERVRIETPGGGGYGAR